MATCAPARDESADYVAWGHSMVVNPWGKILAEADSAETIVYADIGKGLFKIQGILYNSFMHTYPYVDLAHLNDIRKQIPIGLQRRNDLYQVITKQL